MSSFFLLFLFISLHFFSCTLPLHRLSCTLQQQVPNRFSPQQCTNSWEGFSHGKRCFTNTWSDKHCTPTANARPAFYWQSQRCSNFPALYTHTPTYPPTHTHKHTLWLTQGHATAFIWYQTPLLSLWFPIKIKIGCSEIWRQGSLWVCRSTIAMLMQTAKGLF